MSRTAAALCRALEEEPLSAASAAMSGGVSPTPEWVRLVHGVADAPAAQTALAALLAPLIAGQPGAAEDARFERVLVMRQALDALPRLPSLPVCASVKRLWCEEVQAWTEPQTAAAVRVGTHRFVEMCAIATLRRFPGGQFDWVQSGLPLSYLFTVEWRSLPRALYVAATGLRGRAPVFFTHLGCRRQGAALSEPEANRSYHRMACSMALQPAIRGMVASSWFRSPDTHRVSPHLAWVNAVVLEHGGFVAVRGRADLDCGVFERSATRRRLYEEGRFEPTLGLVIWPRQAMLVWAATHPEFGDGEAERGN